MRVPDAQGLSCILPARANTKGACAGWREHARGGVALGLAGGCLTLVSWWLAGALKKALPLWGQATQVHVMDALAITGDEGRGNLRKAPGSW